MGIEECATVCALEPNKCDPSPYCQGYNCCPKHQPKMPAYHPPAMPAYQPPQHHQPMPAYHKPPKQQHQCDSSPYCAVSRCCPRQPQPQLRCYEECFFSGGSYYGGKGGKGGYYGGGGFGGGYYGGFGGKGGKGGKGGGSSFQSQTCVIICETDYNWNEMYFGLDYCFGYGRNKNSWNNRNCYA